MFSQEFLSYAPVRRLAFTMLGMLAAISCGKSERAPAADDAVKVAAAQASAAWGPRYTADGQLMLPKGYERWIYLGSPLTPNALNGDAAPFPEYHNVYIQPEAFDEFRRTGAFPEGTILFKELQLTLEKQFDDGSRTESSGRGFFPGAFAGVDVSVKDTARCGETNGWCYYNFGHHAPPYEQTAAAMPAENCAACHQASAATDMVFTQFYPRLQR